MKEIPQGYGTQDLLGNNIQSLKKKKRERETSEEI